MQKVTGSSPVRSTNKIVQLPDEIKNILQKLANAGFEAYAVGGCVRDLLLGKIPADWDITTNAKPEDIQRVFSDTFYENIFGTVTVKTGNYDPALKEVQITPYRLEAKYTDKRHPSVITFAETLREDLSRRDFAMNAIALSASGEIKDPFEGQKDLNKRLVRTVGKAGDRFSEDALRVMRAIRFAAVLNFEIDTQTLQAIKDNRRWLQAISKERIRDELVKIIESPDSYRGIVLLEQTGLLEFIAPELLAGIGVTQNLHHIYTVWEHNLRALQYTAEKKYSLPVRLAALLHDVAKPQTKRGEGMHATFYGHDVVGARIAAQILARLKFPGDITEKIVRLVRYHMFYYNTDEVTESSVRRLLANVGPENIDDLIKLREADRIGSGTPKAVPYKLRHLKYMLDKVSHDPISVKMLKINGNDIMRILDIAPGPKIGLILNSLLAEVLDDPSKNTSEYLAELVHELDKKSPQELRQALGKIELAQEDAEKERMKKYYV